MSYRPEDASIALDILTTLPAVALRSMGGAEGGGWKTVFITESVNRLGYRREDFMSGRVSLADIVCPEDLPGFLARIDECTRQGQTSCAICCRLLTGNGGFIWAHCACAVVRDTAGRVLHTNWVITDHTEAQAGLEAEVRRAACRDPLTGLTNRYRFNHYLARAIARAEESGGHGFVLFVDMDDFKVINEGYGHQYGDALLVEVARYLQKHFADKCTLFRFGGDEFVLLVEHAHSDEVPAIMDDILNRARHPWLVLNREFYCTVSLGGVRFPESGMGMADVVKNADIAIHSAKSLGKNNCVVFNRGMDNDSLHRAEMERKMRACIENSFEGFEVYYQPMVDINGKIVGAEALLRWFDRDGRLTAPAEFIPLAEYLGLIVPLGNFVLRTAAAECLRINQTMPNFSMNINVSIRQFQQQDFLSTVEEILAETGVDCSKIVLEITEGMLVEDIEQMQLLFAQLRLMGMRVAMDDFGTGYSSLSNMRRLPLDVIKIDRSFVNDVTHDAYSQSFIRLITNLAHSMGRKVCVEGVETAAQYSYCAECHVDRIQGFYFQKPMPKGQLWQALAQNKVRISS